MPLFKYLSSDNKLVVSFIHKRRSWLFSRGLPAIALAQARRAGDISKRIPPGLAVVTEVGFTPWKPWESPSGSSKPHLYDYIP